MARFALRVTSSLIWGEWGLVFYFVLSKIVALPIQNMLRVP